MDRSSSDIETHLPDMGGLRLDELGSVENPVLRRALRRLVREAAQPEPPTAGFNSSVLRSST